VHHFIGYVVMFLVFLGDIGAVVVGRRSMGGDLSMQAAIYFLAIATVGAMYLAWHNIKRQQIDQHRKWMLRAMFWMGIIITMRIIQFFTILATAHVGGYATVSNLGPLSSISSRVNRFSDPKLWTCDEVMFVLGNTTAYTDEFPACRLGTETFVGVPADLKSDLHIGSAVRLSFAMSTWAAIAIHTFGIELYVSTLCIVQFHLSTNIEPAPFDSQGKRAAPNYLVSQTTRCRGCGPGQRRYNVRRLG